MKYSVIFSLIILIAFPAFAEEKYLNDVPEGHYAYDAVYDLLRRGVTGGFPDGTFRGKKLMNRNEFAAFLSKLARSFKAKQGAGEKLVEELKSEFSLQQFAFKKNREETEVSGELFGRWRAGSASSQQGVRSDYRLVLRLNRKFAGDAAGLKINLDSMDGGFNGLARDFNREMIDVEGRVKMGSGYILATAGPGEVAHFDSGLFPGENNIIYRRPWRAASIFANWEKTAFSAHYIARSSFSSGTVEVNEFSLSASRDFSPFRFAIAPRFFFNPAGERDLRLELSGAFNYSRQISAEVSLGIAKLKAYPHGLYYRADLLLAENFKILYQRIGGEYREKFAYNIFDSFDRNLGDGAADLGVEYSVNLGNAWFLKAKGDAVDPNDIITADFRLGKNLSALSAVELIYQTYKAQAFSQAAGISADFKF